MIQQSNYKHYTRGGQISFHNWRMGDQITKTLLAICFGIWLVVCGLLGFYLINKNNLIQACSYYFAKLFYITKIEYVFSIPYHGGAIKQSVRAILTNYYYAKNASYVLKDVLWCTEVSFVIAIFLGVTFAIYFVKRGKNQSAHHFIRGSTLKKPAIVKRQIIQSKNQSEIEIDGFPLIINSEVQHLLVHGTVGTGKSQLIMKLLDKLRERGDKVILYDKGCTFTSLYYQTSKDKILNPFDKRCVRWDLWSEAPHDTDLENMAESLIPMHGDSDPFWVNAARTVFTSAASKMREDPDRSLEKLLRLLLTSEFAQLETYLSGTPAATLVSNKIEKTAISIRSVITTYLKSLQTLVGITGEDVFSIRDYILNESEPGWLFISSNGEQHKSLKPLLSMWLAMASLTILSLKPDSNRRIWIICDELPSLYKLPSLGETIAEVRKFGGCFLLGMQSFSQLEKVYGRSGAQEIFDLLNTRFFFRSPSSDMARLVSRELGEEDMDESREQYSYGANSVRDGISVGNQRIARPIVSYPEILELPNLECYVRLPGNYPVTKLSLKYEIRGAITEGLQSNCVVLKMIAELPQNQDDEDLDTNQQKAFSILSTRELAKERLNEYFD